MFLDNQQERRERVGGGAEHQPQRMRPPHRPRPGARGPPVSQSRTPGPPTLRGNHQWWTLG